MINDLTEDQKRCPIHGSTWIRIGESKREQLEIVPAKVKVIEEITPTYKYPCCSDEGDG